MDRRVLVSHRGATIELSIAVVVVAVLAAIAGWSARIAAATDRAGTEALAAATPATQALFSYDYRSFDASVANGGQFVTGAFATEYAQTTAALRAAATKQHAVVRAEVSSAGVVSSGPDEVDVLLYVNQYRRNVDITGEKVDQNRVVLTLVRTDGGWKVSKALAV